MAENTQFNGIFNVLKPPGMTSQDVVAYLRRVLRTKKVGHGGTLDPDAAGVLPVFAGQATRLLEFAVAGRKKYTAEFTLGRRTDTGDDSGTIVEELPVPPLSAELLQRTFRPFLGRQEQLPPMYSAVKVNGQKLYQLARQGQEVERQARPVEIYRLELLHFTERCFTAAVECSKGTYIRVLGEDLARALGSCGTMSFLLRTQVGAYTLNEAATLQEIAAEPMRYLQEPLTAVRHLPQLALTPKQAARITSGVRTTLRGLADGRYVLLGPDGEFLGLGRCTDGSSMLQAEKIFQRYFDT